MDLLRYLRQDQVETARHVAHNDPISVYAPDDPSDLRRMVHASPALRMALYLGSGEIPEATDLLSLHALAETVRGGAKVIRPSVEVCRTLSHVDLHLHLGDYAQPYEGMGVVIPKEITRTPTDLLAACHWAPGLGIHVATYVGEYLLYQTIGPHWPHTIEEHFGVNNEFLEHVVAEHPQELGKRITRIVLNLGLFAVERGVTEVPLGPKAQWRRRRARYEERFAELAARDAQEVVVQDLDLFLNRTPASSSEGVEGGWRQRMHRRRGHWRMQPHGSGRSQRKRIFVHSYLVNAEQQAEIHTVLS